MFKTLSSNLFPHEKRLTGAAYGVLVLFCLAIFLPGFFTLPVFDRDEPSFAQASKQMVQTGNLVDIRFQDEPRYKKPIGIYWLQAGAVQIVQRIAGDEIANSIWPYRLPSLIGAILAVLLTAALGCKLLNAETGFAAGIMLACCFMLNVETRLAKTDAMLLATIVACQFVLAKAFVQAKALKAKDFLLFWGALAAGFLIKGPLVLLAPLGTLITLKLFKEPISFAKKLNPLLGIPFALLLILPWFILITHQAGAEFYKNSAGHDLFAKIWEVQGFAHQWGFAFPGLYSFILPAMLWPASLPFMLAIPYIWASRHDKDVRFCLAWAIPIWLVFEFTLTKLPHYVLPAYPALCLLAMRWLFSGVRDTGHSLWNGFCYLAFAGVSLGFALIPAALPIMLEGTLFYWALFAGTLAFAACLTAIHLMRGKQSDPSIGLSPLPVAAVMLMASLFGVMLPNLHHLFISEQIVRNLPVLENCEQPMLATAGYSEPSLVFDARIKTEFLNMGERLAVEMKRNPCLIGVVENGQKAEFLEKAKFFQLMPLLTGNVDGFSIGAGKMLKLEIYRTAPVPAKVTPKAKSKRR
ncbi:MAG: glycosyltransferase family 39 protein [Alphaproteobacteria bacterium]|nr:glycosyltransferase family 39 protein [Alphaproteobacteria bacterium]